MKNYLLAFFAIVSTSFLSAQNSKNKFSLGVNMLRYAPPSSGFYDGDEGVSELSFINGFSFGYQQTPILGYIANFRSVKSHPYTYGIDSYTKLSTNGIEISMGPTLSSKEYHRLSLLFTLEVFGEFTKVKGWQTAGDPTIYEECHHKNYFGVAPGLMVNFKISERIFLYAQTRIRLGKVTYKPIENLSPEDPSLFGNQKFSCYQYEPLTGFGLKVTF